ncbi:MAG: hypothetical protein IJF66_02250 [Clostridia bacterium]|nr:hypothetical protein [Clostridia bacterium]
MFRNRFMRLLTLTLMALAIIIPMSVLEILSTNHDWDWSIPDGALFIAPMLVFLICFAGQLFGDVMNVDGWLNNGFVTFIKRVVFFVVAFAAMFVGTGFVFGSQALNDMVQNNASAFSIGIVTANMLSPGIALLAYVFGYISEIAYNKNRLPYFMPITYGAGVLLGLVIALVCNIASLSYNVLSIIVGVLEGAMAVIALVACFKTKKWPFEADYVYSYDSGSSYTSYSSYDDDDYSYSSSSSSSNTPTQEPTECKNCVYFSFVNPEQNLVGDYCMLKHQSIGYFDMLDGCPHYRKSR